MTDISDSAQGNVPPQNSDNGDTPEVQRPAPWERGNPPSGAQRRMPPNSGAMPQVPRPPDGQPGRPPLRNTEARRTEPRPGFQWGRPGGPGQPEQGRPAPPQRIEPGGPDRGRPAPPQRIEPGRGNVPPANRRGPAGPPSGHFQAVDGPASGHFPQVQGGAPRNPQRPPSGQIPRVPNQPNRPPSGQIPRVPNQKTPNRPPSGQIPVTPGGRMSPPAYPVRRAAGSEAPEQPSRGTATAVATEPKPDTAQGRNARLMSDSGSIAIATLISRITGFGKQLLLLTVLGPRIASAFTVSSQIPTMVEQLVLGAVLTAFVVPTLVRAEKEDFDGGAAFVRRLVTMAFVVLGAAALLCTASAPLLIKYIFLSDNGKVSAGLTTALAYLLLPAILCYGMSSLLMAILNTHEIFKPGAWAPVLNNLVVLGVLGLYAVTPGEISLDPVRMGDPKLLILGVGVTFGVFVQVMSLLPPIRRAGIDLRPLWGVDERLKQFGGMGAAVILYVLISQAGFVFGTRISSHADEAGPAIYNNAWLLLQLPYGVLGVTVLTAIMPRLSRNAAADDTPAVVDDLSAATRLTMIALLPVVSFLTIAGPQVGEALYGYGHFGHHQAARLGEAVSWSAFTLIPYALVLIHLRVFYAREQAWTPTWIILGITAVKIVLSALAPMMFSDDYVVIALGVANGLGFTAGAVIGGWLLHRSLGDLRMANVGRTVTRVALASLAAAAVTLIVDQSVGLDRLHHGFGALFRVGVDLIVMFVIAFGLMRLAGIPEIVAITVSITRRLGISAPTPKLDLDAAALEATTVMSRPDLAAPYYYRYEPYMDAQTMVLPVIRPGTVVRTGTSEFPYPVAQANANAESATGATGVPGSAGPGQDDRVGAPIQPVSAQQVEGGTRVSDDAAGAPAADAAASREGAVRTGVPPADVPPAGPVEDEDTGVEPDAADAGDTPPSYETGMLPVHSPEMPPMRVEQPARRAQRGPKLIAGASVAGGRYRLLAAHGGSRGLIFWQALDVKLDREVALTFVDADQKATENSGSDGPQAILSRTLRLGRINSPGLARVLDVVRGSSGGIVVAEWTPGRSLREMAETIPSPIGAARAIRVLAAAAELAHRGGGSLSIDSPDRIRISASGDAVLAFPGTLSDSDAQSDVRGLGAMLYALITARWPIRTGGVTGKAAMVGGLPLADFGPDGTPVEPRQIRPEVPFEISAVAVRSLESNKGVRTAATVQHVLEQASVVDQKTDFIPVLRLGQRAVSAPDESLADPEMLAAERERSQRMLYMLIGLGVLAALVVGVIIWWLVNMFAPASSTAPLDEQRKLGLTTAASAPANPTAGAPSASASSVPAVPVPLTSASVFSPEGTPDSPAAAGATIDGNPTTSWHTDQYFQQFPALKKGVGIVATLANPSKLTGVSIDSPSPGTVVEIRTAPAANATLDQTQLIGQATLGDGTTEIAVKTDQPARFVLVWITQLGNSGGQFQTTISEIRCEAAA